MIAAAWQQSTRKKYGQWWTKFSDFVQGAGLQPGRSLDHAVEAVLNFGAQLAAQQRFSTAAQVVCALASILKIERNFAVSADGRVKAFLKGLKKLGHIYKEPRPRREPLSPLAVAYFVEHPPVGISQHQWALAAAIATVGLRCIRRGKELRDLEEHHLVDVGPGVAKIRVVFSKTDPAGVHNLDVPFERGATAADPIACIDRYLRVAKGSSLRGWSGRPGVPLFLNENGSRLSDKHVRSMVNMIARHANQEGVFGAHSLRIGGAASGIGGGLSQEQIMAIGGWRSESSLGAYARAIVGVQQRASVRMGL